MCHRTGPSGGTWSLPWPRSPSPSAVRCSAITGCSSRFFYTHMIFDFNSIAWIALLAIDDAIILRGRTQARTRVHTIMLHQVSRRITSSFLGGAEHRHWYSNTYNRVTMPLPHCNARPPPAPLYSIMRTPSSPPLHSIAWASIDTVLGRWEENTLLTAR